MVTISEYTKRRLIEEFDLDPERVAVIPCGVALDRFTPVDEGRRQALRSRLGIPVDSSVVLYVGSEQRRKNLRPLMDGLAECLSNVPALVFVKVGVAQSKSGRRAFELALRKRGLEKPLMTIRMAK